MDRPIARAASTTVIHHRRTWRAALAKKEGGKTKYLLEKKQSGAKKKKNLTLSASQHQQQGIKKKKEKIKQPLACLRGEKRNLLATHAARCRPAGSEQSGRVLVVRLRENKKWGGRVCGGGERREAAAVGGCWSAQNGAAGVDNGRWAVLLTLGDHGAGRQARQAGEGGGPAGGGGDGRTAEQMGRG